MERTQLPEGAQAIYDQFVELYRAFSTQFDDESDLDLEKEEEEEDIATEAEFEFELLDSDLVETPVTTTQEILEKLYVIDAAYDLLNLMDAATQEKLEKLAEVVLKIVDELA